MTANRCPSAPPATEPGDSLAGKFLSGTAWAFALRFSSRLFGLIRTVVLARLLLPEDFGIVGLALLAVAVLEVLTQPGLQTALIQKKSAVDGFLDSAWTVQAMRGGLLFAILFLSAPAVSGFFDSHALTPVLQVISLSVLISGFGNIGVLFFQKQLELRKQFLYEFFSSLVDFAVSVLLAFILRDFWALVWGGLAGNVTRLGLSYFLHPYRPRLRIAMHEVRELFAYGRWVFGSGILLFLIGQGDSLVVGKWLGVAALGFYQMAYLISNLPATEIANALYQVSLPLYSQMQEDRARARRVYLGILQVSLVLAAPLAAAIAVLSGDIARVVFGPAWTPMAGTMQILSLAAFVRMLPAVTRPLLQGLGMPRTDTLVTLAGFAALAVSILPLSLRYGIEGAAAAVLASSLVRAIGFGWAVRSAAGISVRSLFMLFLAPIAGSGSLILALLALRGLIDTLPGLLFLSLSFLAGCVAYALTVIFVDRLQDSSLTRTLREYLPHPVSVVFFRGTVR